MILLDLIKLRLRLRSQRRQDAFRHQIAARERAAFKNARAGLLRGEESTSKSQAGKDDRR
ncbi:hypothetical protein P7F60_18370 [Rhizobium sp. YJ-22]|uniref:hypothetical protein n=1 Tax=Rhizobium sp. YJ-22 TaxID=3037556 RepID=UPI0024123C85|nr:hypothetical protein [Rhizobium sp. YJ-22]MDG3578365.1 hypothetical protein [Rhizobium sp. YJ-22]